MIDKTNREGAFVSGKIYFVSEDEMKRIDQYEGGGYRRAEAMAVYDEGKVEQVYVYVKAR